LHDYALRRSCVVLATIRVITHPFQVRRVLGQIAPLLGYLSKLPTRLLIRSRSGPPFELMRLLKVLLSTGSHSRSGVMSLVDTPRSRIKTRFRCSAEI
jgi:hypothetical protein